ncbi:tRNA threonylcarbamoyladenosine dehydratase [Prolixibacteraceae bacterium JC049]|nr:tRNA threonylcarbamoyladenosine dehydratase [Prolixibacteraceae bacterium JC049]
MEWLERTQLLVGEEGLAKLQNAKVLIVGLGGVGAYAAEQICRAGVGNLTIVDGDVVDTTNRNRQLPALISTTGKPKAEILKERFLDINPDLNLTVINAFLKDENMIELLEEPFDYVVDCIDTLAPKVYLIYHAMQRGYKVISSMGAGGKFDPMQVKVADISKTHNCNLARMLRKRLYKLGVRKGFKAIFSPELIDKSKVIIDEGQNKKSVVGTISYMPPVFGCHCAAALIKDILES